MAWSPDKGLDYIPIPPDKSALVDYDRSHDCRHCKGTGRTRMYCECKAPTRMTLTHPPKCTVCGRYAYDAQHKLPEDLEGARQKDIPAHQLCWPVEQEGGGAVLEETAEQGEETGVEETKKVQEGTLGRVGMQLEELVAGRELDYIIAKEIFDLTCLKDPPYGILLPTNIQVKNYSTQIADAWLVKDKLTTEWRFRLTEDFKRPNDEPRYRAAFCKWGTKAHRAYADTAPLAICKAALKAIGYD